MTKKIRSSNIEFYRIAMMLIIIAHHLVVNSGVVASYDYQNITGNMIFLQLFGFGGKPMIDGFLLITGFFSVKSKFTVEKALRVFLEIFFYKVGFYLLFGLIGFHKLTSEGLFGTVFYVFRSADGAFPATYFWLYCLTPFINKMALNLTKRQFQGLLAVLLTYFTIISTAFRKIDTFSELGWYITAYLIGSYLQLHEPRILNKCWKSGLLTLAALVACYGSILLLTYGRANGTTELDIYYYVSNAHKPLGLLLAVTSFQWFRHMKLPNSRVINTVASSIFGVLLIHANSNTMRTKLWKDWLDIRGHYDWEWLPLYAIIAVICIFLICTAMDQVRIHLLEKPFFKLYRIIEAKVKKRFVRAKSITVSEVSEP